MIQSGEIHREAILKDNLFMDMLLPMATMGKLDDASLNHYHQVLRHLARGVVAISSRLTSSRLGDMALSMISEYSLWPVKQIYRKLMLYSMPGFMTSMAPLIGVRVNYLTWRWLKLVRVCILLKRQILLSFSKV